MSLQTGLYMNPKTKNRIIDYRKERINLKNLYKNKKREIESQIKKFTDIWTNGTDIDIFSELAFCILTPQSKAKTCWAIIEYLKKTGILFNGNIKELSKILKAIRFYNNKSKYILNARDRFFSSKHSSIKNCISKFQNPHTCREWLVKNIKGFGYKEASHFLRNIGKGEKLAILDRHILRNMKKLGLIEEVPITLTKNKYIMLEKILTEFSKKINIPLSHLDLLLWYKETGEIFK